jgi:hypothetical protein
MGRYAFFNTGIEYKFRFAIQPSEDMLDFFGISYDGPDEGCLIHKWKKTDAILIKEQLDDELILSEKIDITKFENNMKGTYDLKYYLGNISDISNNHRYILGYLIYHQLQYEDNLSVEYEL